MIDTAYIFWNATPILFRLGPLTVCWYGLFFALAFLRIDITPRHPAQLRESLAYGLIVLLLFRTYRRRGGVTPRGLLLGLFLVTVFTARFFIEFVKAQQAAYQLSMLNVGQWLSIPLIVAGAVLLYRARPARAETPGEHQQPVVRSR